MCKAHNGYLAEREYGKDVMDKFRRSGRVSESPSTYGAEWYTPGGVPVVQLS